MMPANRGLESPRTDETARDQPQRLGTFGRALVVLLVPVVLLWYALRGLGVDVLPTLTRGVAALARRLGRRLATLAHDASHCLLVLVRLLSAAVLAVLRVLGARARHGLSAGLIA